jgi:hypothetical protein
MTEFASNSNAAPEEPTRRRWYRRPWVLLSLTGFAVLGTVPFAIRGYQLSLLPDIPDPFGDLPPVAIPTTGGAKNPFVQQFGLSAGKLDDAGYWLSVAAPNRQERFSFTESLWQAERYGFDDAPPFLSRYATESEPLLREWLTVLDWYGSNQSHSGINRQFDGGIAHRIRSALLIVTHQQLATGTPEKAVELPLRVLNSLNRLRPATTNEFIQLFSLRRAAHFALLHIAESPDSNDETLVAILFETKKSQPVSQQFRVNVLRQEYARQTQAIDDWVNRLNAGDRLLAYVTAQGELSQMILRVAYSGYRNQASVLHRNRKNEISILKHHVNYHWFDGADGLGVTRNQVEHAISQSVLLSGRMTPSGPLLAGRTYLGMFEHETAELRQIQTTLACQLYLRVHGSLPNSLDDLVPDYLPAVPEDPLTKSGPHLLYRNYDFAAVVYSRGWNGADDGGRVGTALGADWYGDDRGILIRDLVNHPEQAERSETTE